MFREKKIGLGICGSIAAYKICDLASYLVQQGAQITVFMTPEAEKFITPLTFKSITSGEVLTNENYFSNTQAAVSHINLTKELDLFLIAPATANIISKAVSGIADEIVSTIILAASCAVVFAPAMHEQMYNKPIIQENIKKLKARGFYFIDPEKGHLASGDYGKGRLASREKILDTLQVMLHKKKAFIKKKF